MVVSHEHIGKLFGLINSGARFQVSDVTDQYVIAVMENGKQVQMTHEVDCIPELDPDRIAAFHRSLSLAKALNAAEQAAHRYAASHDPADRQDSARVLHIVEEQRDALNSRLYEKT